MVFPSLETDRLLLTELRVEDEAELFNLFSNPSVIEYYDLNVFREHNQAANLINLFNERYHEQQGIRWAIRLKPTGQLIGTCGFNSWNSKMRNAVIGYELHPQFWRCGYTVEAVRAIVDAGFSGILACGKLNRIQADTIPENIASESLLLRLGFKEEGLRRECGFWKNKFHDLKCFGLLRSEFSPI
ncbi:GNAT family protein [Pseudoalteromonas sp. B131b]|uniref:GNAT family N-acetyltransferase n=1 Tax=unclassified Pseudoalteromonas TaxID=194690 RepID=UPI000BBE52DE|nr:GNAT family protein [Pseudoalteromonas sp. 1_2015MBL_MicDiv]ATG77145.1 GNAT family acetyltransferase [Pseudoalteromonas sp. 1_2015MBL_MicDiv]